MNKVEEIKKLLKYIYNDHFITDGIALDFLRKTYIKKAKKKIFNYLKKPTDKNLIKVIKYLIIIDDLNDNHKLKEIYKKIDAITSIKIHTSITDKNVMNNFLENLEHETTDLLLLEFIITANITPTRLYLILAIYEALVYDYENQMMSDKKFNKLVSKIYSCIEKCYIENIDVFKYIKLDYTLI